MLEDSIGADHLHGEDAAAVECVLDGLALAAAAGHVRPTTVWVENGDDGETQRRVLNALQGVLPDVVIGDGPGQVRRATVERLVRQLRDESAVAAAWERAVRGSVFFTVADMAYVGSRLRVLAPMADLEVARTADRFASALAAARQPDLPAAVAAAGPRWSSPAVKRYPLIYPSADDPSAPRCGRQFSDQSADWVPAAIANHFRVVAVRRATAVLLALRLYRLDHGRWPAAVADLAPAYLPAVPLDPVAGGGTTIAYAAPPPAGGNAVRLAWGCRPTLRPTR